MIKWVKKAMKAIISGEANVKLCPEPSVEK